jgi:hypothetical protein
MYFEKFFDSQIGIKNIPQVMLQWSHMELLLE